MEKYTIGILIGNICASHSDDLLNGLVHKAKEEDVQTVVFMGAHANCFDELYYYKGGNKEQKYLFQYNTVFDYANLGKLDLLLVVYSTFYLYMKETKEEFFDRFSNLKIPIIIVGDEFGDMTSVITDNGDGIRKCMRHLFDEHGCKKIVYLGGPKNNNRDAQERYQAYLQMMEERGYEVTENMVEFGDYSANSAPLFGKLLDSNPGVDGVVCANDTMALSGYEECRKRGLVPGVDVAITGFDDIPEARFAMPPLTTIEQNAYDLGFVAMEKAVEMLREGRMQSAKVPVYFKHRASCGNENENMSGIGDRIEHLSPQMRKQEIARECTRNILEKSFLYKLMIMEDKATYDRVYRLCYHIVDVYLDEEDDRVYDMEFIKECVDGLVNSKKLAVSSLMTELTRQVANVMFMGKDEERIGALSALLLHIVDYVQNKTIIDTNYRYDNLQRNIWTTPFITRDMIANIDDREQLYESLMERLSFMKIRSAYMFLLKENKINRSIQDWSCPAELQLVAKIEDGVITENMEGEWLDARHGLTDIFTFTANSNMAVYSLFAGKRMYGMLASEMTADNITSMYSVALHIGSAFQFIDLMRKQRKVQSELELAMNALKSKNDLLNMISEKDELTGLYNRRGFWEKAMVLAEAAKNGKYVLCLYADLDHLKQINDEFGHKEGDFAICQTARYLQDCLRATDVIGRIGGDEFAAVAIVHDSEMGAEIRNRIKARSEAFNAESDKPYYVEVSIGYAVFTYSENLELTHMLNEADQMLYENKKARRKFARKSS